MGNKVFVFSIQDNTCGGVIYAKTANKAREALSKQRGMEVSEKLCEIYALSDVILDKEDCGVIDLW